jgi:DNA-binding transcriptional LysR family regulator
VAILEALANADSLVSDRCGEARGRLRVSVPVEFGRKVIAPHLGEFLAQYPELELSLNLSDDVIDLSKERIDVSVRLGTAVSSDDIVCKPVGKFERWIVGSPGYLVQTCLPAHPQDLLEHCCLKFDYGTAQQAWQLRLGEAHFSVPVTGRLQSNNADILREAALEGQGLTLLADWLVEDDVQAGRLTRVLCDYQANPGNANATINVMFLPNQRGSSRIKVFVEFLQRLLSAR